MTVASIPFGPGGTATASSRLSGLFRDISLEQRTESLALKSLKITESENYQGILNGNSIWSTGKKGDSVTNAFLQWKNHGHEFSNLQNSSQYVEKAYSLFRKPLVLHRIRSSDGAHLSYDPFTNTFGSFTPQGVPKIMFKSGVSQPLLRKYSNPMEYFYEQ